MIPNKTEIKQTGSLGGEEVKMTFDEDSLGFLAGVLSDLYSDRELAIIREYSTNARDSHRAAGQTKPIEITTPSAFSHYFKVKDYGVGMSVDDIRQIYSKYGASTKREDQTVNGMLGLGCKSALAYTDQFTITSVKNGIKINVLVSRAEDGGGTMSVVSEAITDESNGVEVCIPVDRNNGFNLKAKNFFYYWNENEVLVNGVKPARAMWKQLSTNLWQTETSSWNQRPVIVMGGVPYQVDTSQVNMPTDLIAFVEIGAVDFPPNREALKYTAKTKSTLNRIKSEYLEAIRNTIQLEVDACKDKKSALKKFENWMYRISKYQISIKDSAFSYKGHPLETTFSVETRWIPGAGQTSTFDARMSSVMDEVLIYDFPGGDITPYQKRKLKFWGEQNGVSVGGCYLVTAKPESWWLEDIVKVSWKDIIALKLTQGTKKKPAYDAYIDGKFQNVTELDKTRPIFYSTKTEFKRVSGDNQRRVDRTNIMTDVQFVFVAETRLTKFLKLFPSAVSLKEGVLKKAEQFKQSVSDGQWIRLVNDSYTLDRYSVLDPNKISDPELVDFINIVLTNKDDHSLRQQYNLVHGWVYEVTYSNFTYESNNEIVKMLETRYPLLKYVLGGSVSDKFKNHVYLYLETVYKTEVKETNEVHKS